MGEVEAWSNEGAQCPNCNIILEPDGAEFYDENELWQHECTCGVTFSVQASLSIAWETVVIPKEPAND